MREKARETKRKRERERERAGKSVCQSETVRKSENK